MNLLVVAGLLLLLGIALVVLEVFVPSGGVIAFLAFVTVAASVVLAFRDGTKSGLIVLSLACIFVPLALTLALRVWPSTPMGRRLLLNPPTADEVLPDAEYQRELRSLVGRVGKAKSLMVPSGACEFDGQVVNAVSEGVAIDAGQAVRVTDVRGNRVVVRPYDGKPLPAQATQTDPELSRPIETLGFDPFEDPLA
jgi:membrane-bound ClpP family serine protease